jgi:predicted RNase H-like nuclease (RuvC/YqgF family)
MPKPIIVGLDIGTTSAISIHDLKKNLLYLKSKKHNSTSNMIKQITIFGTPLIIATDKQNVPEKIRKIAASFGAEIFSPDHDLTIEEKENIVNISMTDSHERDALASSLFAFRFYYPQFSTIDFNLQSMGLQKHSDRVKEMVIRKEAKNIADAINRVKPKDAPEKETICVNQVNVDFEQRTRELERKLRSEMGSHEILRDYVEKLENRVRSLQVQKQEYMEEQMKKNEDARKQIIKDKELRNRDLMIRQLKFQLEKEKSIKGAYEEKNKIDMEIKEIRAQRMIPVIMIPNFSKEDILDAHRKYNISDKAVWVQNFSFSKVAAKVLASLRPKIVIGETDRETNGVLHASDIIVVGSVKPEIRSQYAAVSPEKIESEMKKLEKKNFLKWLEEYKHRY